MKTHFCKDFHLPLHCPVPSFKPFSKSLPKDSLEDGHVSGHLQECTFWVELTRSGPFQTFHLEHQDHWVHKVQEYPSQFVRFRTWLLFRTRVLTRPPVGLVTMISWSSTMFGCSLLPSLSTAWYPTASTALSTIPPFFSMTVFGQHKSTHKLETLTLFDWIAISEVDGNAANLLGLIKTFLNLIDNKHSRGTTNNA